MATITFKVKGNTYTCEEGTTWKEFIENSPNHYPIMKRVYRDNGADGSYSRPWVKHPFFDNDMIITRGYRTDGSWYENEIDIESAIDPNQTYYRSNLDDDDADSYITIDNFRIVYQSDINMGIFAYASVDNYFGLTVESRFDDPIKTHFKGNQIYHSDGSMLMGDYEPKDGDAFYTLTKKEIKFKIDNKEYTSVAGLTWIDWVNSDYNTDGFTIDETDLTGYIIKDGNDNKVKSSEYARFDKEIIENETYTLMGAKKDILIKNPIILIGSKAKKVIVDNINMTIDVWTKEVPSGMQLSVTINHAWFDDSVAVTLYFNIPYGIELNISTFQDIFNIVGDKWYDTTSSNYLHWSYSSYTDAYYLDVYYSVTNTEYGVRVGSSSGSENVYKTTILTKLDYYCPYGGGGSND